MYYIYYNWQADGEQLKIHTAGCGFCNNGNGPLRNNVEAGRNGVWIGGFLTIEYVNNFIERMNIENATCNFCMPE